ncbi:MAG: carboxymuconolactone decarboxylase family protein [Pseudomonadota bacterium]
MTEEKPTDETSREARGMAFFRAHNAKAAARMEAMLGGVAPDLMRYAAEFAFGDVYAREGLAKRDRQLVTLAALATRGDAGPQLEVHIAIALSLGIRREEIAEVFIQLAPYAGFPTAINAAAALARIAPEPAGAG